MRLHGGVTDEQLVSDLLADPRWSEAWDCLRRSFCALLAAEAPDAEAASRAAGKLQRVGSVKTTTRGSGLRRSDELFPERRNLDARSAPAVRASRASPARFVPSTNV